MKSYKFGNRMGRKSWKLSDDDKNSQDRQLTFLFLGLIVFFLLLAVVEWLIKSSLHH